MPGLSPFNVNCVPQYAAISRALPGSVGAFTLSIHTCAEDGGQTGDPIDIEFFCTGGGTCITGETATKTYDNFTMAGVWNNFTVNLALEEEPTVMEFSTNGTDRW